MNATAEPTTMSYPLTPARQNELLSRCQWTPEGKVRVQATHHTEPLLKSAGVSHPQPLEFYPVDVRRDARGLLVIDHEGKSPPVCESSAELFEPGGIFAGEEPPAMTVPPSTRVENVSRLIEDIKDGIRTRRFEVQTGERSCIHIQVLAYDDKQSREATDSEIHAAVSALHMARALAHFEH